MGVATSPAGVLHMRETFGALAPTCTSYYPNKSFYSRPVKEEACTTCSTKDALPTRQQVPRMLQKACAYRIPQHQARMYCPSALNSQALY